MMMRARLIVGLAGLAVAQVAAAAQLKPGDFDWNAIFGAGVRWFHSGGIFAALSDTTGALILEGMQEARRHGAVVSFDLNYREKLWRATGGHARALSTLGGVMRTHSILAAVRHIRLVLSGTDTDLDRRILDELRDPLMHMVRNTIDHGIEAPQDRLLAGKTAHGTLSISATSRWLYPPK